MPRKIYLQHQMLNAFIGLFIWAAPRMIVAKLGLTADTDLISIILLVILGVIMAYGFPSVKAWMWGLSAVIMFPLYSLYEAEVSMNPHNLFPFEFIFTYPYLAAFVIIGATIGKWIKQKISRKPNTPLEPSR